MIRSPLGKSVAVGLVAVLAISAGCTYWSHDFAKIVDQSGRDFERDPGRNYVEVSLEEILSNPTVFKLMDVGFTAMMDRRAEGIFAPIYSTFRQEDFFSFSVWPLKTRVWEIEDRVGPGRAVPTLYMRKDNSHLQKLMEIPRYAGLEIYGKVMGDFGGMPFIEVHYVYYDAPEYTEESVAHMVSGLHAPPAQAIPALEQALKGTLASPARFVVHLRLARLYEDRRVWEKAMQHYRMAYDLDETFTAAMDGAQRCWQAQERQRAIEAGREATP